MRYTTLLLLLASIVVILQLHKHSAQAFQFSVPGQWGGQVKRRGSGNFRFSVPGQWGNNLLKRSGREEQCEITDPVKLRNIFQLLQEEAFHIANCLQAVENRDVPLQ